MSIPQNIDNTKDTIDSLDVIARIDWLELSDDTDDVEERTQLLALQEEAEDYAPDWKYGVTLIRESYFVEYCQQSLEVSGYDLPHYIVIDWEATADNIRVDYTEVDFDGVTYLVR